MIGPAAGTAGGNLDQTANRREEREEERKLLMLRPVSQPAHQDSVTHTTRPRLVWQKKKTFKKTAQISKPIHAEQTFRENIESCQMI